jgi:hypothetical protein
MACRPIEHAETIPLVAEQSPSLRGGVSAERRERLPNGVTAVER